MRKYWAYYVLGLQTTLAYRGPMLFWLAGNVISLICMMAVWLAAEAGSTIGGYTKSELISYYLVGLVVQWFVGWYPSSWIKEDIKSGAIVGGILLKPVNFYWRAFMAEIAWHTISIFAGLASAIVVGYFFKDYLITNIFSGISPLFLIAVWLCAILCFCFSLCLGLLAFWFIETQIFDNLFWAGLSLVGGYAVPLSFFPSALQGLINFLPFRYMYAFALEIYFGKVSSQNIIIGFVIQLCWIVIFTILFRFMWVKGAKVYSAWGQ